MGTWGNGFRLCTVAGFAGGDCDQAVQSVAFGEPLLGASSSKPTRGAGAQRSNVQFQKPSGKN